MTAATTTHHLEVPGAVVAYDVHRCDAPGQHRPLLVFGSPMGASGFAQLVPHLADRTVITYDPRMSERSRLDAGGEVSFEAHADDVHRVVAATGLAPVDVFASSGGGVVALPWLLAHPEDVRTVVLHEPPLSELLEDADVIERISSDIVETYQRDGQGFAMAKFIRLVMSEGVLAEDYLDQPAPPPEQFGFSSVDDGSRDDPLLGHNMRIPPHRPDGEALRASGVRIVPAAGAASGPAMPRRAAEALAGLLGAEVVEFPGDHGGFAASDWSPTNDPGAFAAKLCEVLAQTSG